MTLKPRTTVTTARHSHWVALQNREYGGDGNKRECVIFAALVEVGFVSREDAMVIYTDDIKWGCSPQGSLSQILSPFFCLIAIS
jgi:hypothetical protein